MDIISVEKKAIEFERLSHWLTLSGEALKPFTLCLLLLVFELSHKRDLSSHK